ncbi:uncharacterized protein LOC121390172 [Gigantopelta aegis]|uniref:uncharacterized protein LOC121390172 n=1 Tax=Gigantopelta aegis TaxID=1735272 RepID=UPI001B888A6E|nr:uncharacterized protein LOC121390172 [Gigantopelta aegis]
MCGPEVFFLLGFSVCLSLMYIISIYNRPIASVEPTLNIRDQPDAPNQSKVFKWTGKGWQRLINFCTWSDFHDCSMLKTPNGDTPIFHHDPKHDYTSGILMNSGMKEPQTIRSILDYLAHDHSITFLDVGAHVGSIGLQMAKAGYAVVTVDPLPENVGRLCKSVERGRFVDSVTILFSPVSDAHKTVAFKRKWNIGETKVELVSTEHTEYKTATPSCELSPLLSSTATLDNVLPFIKSHKVFVKIDVESHEYFVIKGAEDFFRQKEVVGIFMEWIHVKKTPEAVTLISLLNNYGFKAYELNTMVEALINEDYKNWPMDVIWKRP